MGNGSSKRRVASVTAPPKQLLEEQSKLGWKELLFPSVLDKTRLQPYSVSTEELNFMWDQFLEGNDIPGEMVSDLLTLSAEDKGIVLVNYLKKLCDKFEKDGTYYLQHSDRQDIGHALLMLTVRILKHLGDPEKINDSHDQVDRIQKVLTISELKMRQNSDTMQFARDLEPVLSNEHIEYEFESFLVNSFVFVTMTWKLKASTSLESKWRILQYFRRAQSSAVAQLYGDKAVAQNFLGPALNFYQLAHMFSPSKTLLDTLENVTEEIGTFLAASEGGIPKTEVPVGEVPNTKGFSAILNLPFILKDNLLRLPDDEQFQICQFFESLHPYIPKSVKVSPGRTKRRSKKDKSMLQEYGKSQRNRNVGEFKEESGDDAHHRESVGARDLRVSSSSIMQKGTLSLGDTIPTGRTLKMSLESIQESSVPVVILTKPKQITKKHDRDSTSVRLGNGKMMLDRPVISKKRRPRTKTAFEVTRND